MTICLSLYGIKQEDKFIILKMELEVDSGTRDIRKLKITFRNNFNALYSLLIGTVLFAGALIELC